MKKKPIVLVTGATGAQGGSVAEALLNQNHFTVRCLTRNAVSQKARALQDKGAEIAEGNLDDTNSLIAAMKDCYGVFGVTNFWEHFEKEFQQGKNLVDAVKASGIEHFVFSTLPSYNQLSQGTLQVPHCDIKAALEEYSRSLNLPFTFVHVAFYYENFFQFFPPQPTNDGGYEFGFPQGDTRLAMVSVEDLGGVVAPIFAHPDQYIGRTVGVVGEDRTCTEYATIMSEVLQRKVRYQYIPRETYAAFPFPGAEELANMFEVQRLYIPQRQLEMIESYGLHPGMQSFATWLHRNKYRFNQTLVAEELTSLS